MQRNGKQEPRHQIAALPPEVRDAVDEMVKADEYGARCSEIQA